MRAWYVRKWPAMHKQPQIQLPDKNKGVDVLQSQALYIYRTCYQASITSCAELTERWLGTAISCTKCSQVADYESLGSGRP